MKAKRFAILIPLLLFPVLWLVTRQGVASRAPERSAKPAAGSSHRERPWVAADTAVEGSSATGQPVAAKVIDNARGLAGDEKFLAPDFLDRIVNGKAVAFTLPDGSQAEGTVEMSERDAQGILRVQGRLTRPAAGRYFLQRQNVTGVAGPFVGNVLFDGKDEGWKVEPAEDRLAARLVPRPVDQITCAGYQRTPEADKLEMEEMMLMTDFRGPQDHPTDQPFPPYQEVPALQSMPGATGVIYLDFDGEKGPHQGWGSYDAERPNTTSPQIIEIWKQVAEDFQPFNLNVTTDRKVFDNAPQGRRQKVIITPTTTGTPYGAAGVAFLGSFNWGGDYPCWAHYTVGIYAAHVISHEVGHTLG
ncbi:MAG TPA: hypothetical protein VF258_08995, partial [Luteolibacter sp.]